MCPGRTGKTRDEGYEVWDSELPRFGLIESGWKKVFFVPPGQGGRDTSFRDTHSDKVVERRHSVMKSDTTNF